MSNGRCHHDGADTWCVDAPTWCQSGLGIPSGALAGHDLFFSHFLFGWDRARTWPAIYMSVFFWEKLKVSLSTILYRESWTCVTLLGHHPGSPPQHAPELMCKEARQRKSVLGSLVLREPIPNPGTPGCSHWLLAGRPIGWCWDQVPGNLPVCLVGTEKSQEEPWRPGEECWRRAGWGRAGGRTCCACPSHTRPCSISLLRLRCLSLHLWMPNMVQLTDSLASPGPLLKGKDLSALLSADFPGPQTAHG